MLKAYAVLAPESTYYPCQLIKKGDCIDPLKGEYQGVNKATDDRTKGITKKIFLHSIFDYPHTACSCFQNIAFYIPEVNGIATIDKGYRDSAPGRWTWNKLANLIVGRQYRGGIASIGTQYLRSPKFLQADGGYKRVVWMSEKLLYFAKDFIQEEHLSHIATEKNARTLNELMKFIDKQK
jgi:acetyl-CoA decarbonylase/synthase complex subunit beta